MDEPQFWTLVESAKASAGASLDQRPVALESLLLAQSLESIQSFQHRYDELLIRANRWDLWGAAYLMNDGCSDDGFRYFRDWLISEGRAAFEQALADPDCLAEIPKCESFELELFGYAALEAYEKNGGGELERDFMQVEAAPPGARTWSKARLPGLFPRLAAKYPGR